MCPDEQPPAIIFKPMPLPDAELILGNQRIKEIKEQLINAFFIHSFVSPSKLKPKEDQIVKTAMELDKMENTKQDPIRKLELKQSTYDRTEVRLSVFEYERDRNLIQSLQERCDAFERRDSDWQKTVSLLEKDLKEQKSKTIAWEAAHNLVAQKLNLNERNYISERKRADRWQEDASKVNAENVELKIKINNLESGSVYSDLDKLANDCQETIVTQDKVITQLHADLANARSACSPTDVFNMRAFKDIQNLQNRVDRQAGIIQRFVHAADRVVDSANIMLCESSQAGVNPSAFALVPKKQWDKLAEAVRSYHED